MLLSQDAREKWYKCYVVYLCIVGRGEVEAAIDVIG